MPGKTGIELAFTDLRAGYAMRRADGIKVSGGLHGVGVSVVNALSEWLECEVKQNGKVHQMRFERGVPTGPLIIVGDCPPNETGTRVTWLPDKSVFAAALGENGTLFQPERLRRRLRQTAFLNPQMTTTLHDLHGKTPPETFHFPQGIAEYVAYLNAQKTVLHNPIFFTHFDEGETEIEAALQYTDTSDDPVILLFVNNYEVTDGGTAVSGFKSSLTRVVNRCARKTGLLQPGDVRFSGDLVRQGLTAVIAIRMSDPHFCSATRDRLINWETEGTTNRAVGKPLAAFLDENPGAARAIIEKIISCR